MGRCNKLSSNVLQQSFFITFVTNKSIFMEEEVLKQRVQKVILVVSLIILVGKFVGFYLTNSVGILTDAMESIVNVVAGFVSLYSLIWSAKSKDKDHPFGHGKMEFISASLEGLLISLAGALIIYEGILRLFTPTLIQKLDIGILIIAIGGALNYIMGYYSVKIGKKHDSMALIAGGKHLQSDTYSTIGLILGLLILYYTQIAWIDSALAIVFGGIIVATGVMILRKTIANLLDKADTELLNKIAKCINSHRQDDWIDVHNTKIIKYGSYIYIDCDLTLPWFYNIKESHDACEELNRVLLQNFSEKIQISIHSDPCNVKYCKICGMHSCKYRQNDFIALQNISISDITMSDEERERVF